MLCSGEKRMSCFVDLVFALTPCRKYFFGLQIQEGCMLLVVPEHGTNGNSTQAKEPCRTQQKTTVGTSNFFYDSKNRKTRVLSWWKKKSWPPKDEIGRGTIHKLKCEHLTLYLGHP
ncbi:unnamed protein product [Ixodes persulcatus]